VIELDNKEWERLFRQVFVVAVRMTRSKDPTQEVTQIDRAREATQRAFDRCLRVRPAHLDTVEALRMYLSWAVRSALSHANEEHALRRENEAAVVTELATVGSTAVASAETMTLEVAASERERQRAVRALKRLREELADDRIALGTVECIAAGKTEPADQAGLLKCSIEEVHAARKRRKRALKRILDADEADYDDEEYS